MPHPSGKPRFIEQVQRGDSALHELSNGTVFRGYFLSQLDQKMRQYILEIACQGKHYIRNICKAYDLKLLATAEAAP